MMADDESSRLKQFSWEQLDENLVIAVLYRANRRFFVQRHFEEQVLALNSLPTIKKWRRYLSQTLSRVTSPLYLTSNEVLLMHEILRWHLNDRSKRLQLQAHVDYMIDFEDLLDVKMNGLNNNNINNNNLNERSFVMEPVTTLHEASRTIAMWKDLQQDKIKDEPRSTVSCPNNEISRSVHHFERSLSTGWLQLDHVAIPYLIKQSDRFLSIELLVKERLISSSDEFHLRPWHTPATIDEVRTLNTLTRHPSTLNFVIALHSPLIALDYLIFSLRHLFFIRFISSPSDIDQIDCDKIMSLKGGILTIVNHRRLAKRLPYIFINNQQYIPQVNGDDSSVSTFCIATQTELAFLRLIALYDSLSLDQGDDNNLYFLSSTDSISLIPVPYQQRRSITAISLDEFHYREYQRRSQQNLRHDEKEYYHKQSNSTSGWWQAPASSSSRPAPPANTISHYKMQRPVLF